jgi:preprotein translocase subunit SecF
VREIIRSGTDFDFLGKWKFWVAISVTLITLGGIFALVRGVRLGVDFAGGTEMQVRFHDGVTVDEGAVRAVLDELDVPGPSVIRYGAATDYLVRFQGERHIPVPGEPTNAPLSPKNDRVRQVDEAFDSRIGPHEIERVEFVGPKVGQELRNKGILSMGLAFLLILGYVAFRFSASFAPGAVIALIHDVLVTASVWTIFNLEFDLTVLAALLAIIGYSLNDTIIIYDRVRENLQMRSRSELQKLLNESVNQTLSRTILTALLSLGAIGSLLVAGGPVIRPFALAMFIGTIVGTYSTIYIASPMVLWIETWRSRRATRAPARPAPKAAPKAAKAKR